MRAVFYSDNLESYKAIYDSHGNSFKFKIIKRSEVGKAGIISLENINDRNAAEKLINSSFFVKHDELPKLEENEFYVCDLIGKNIKIAGSDEKCKIVGVQNFGASDLIEIVYKDGNSFYVPFTKENFTDSYDSKIMISREAVDMYKM